MRHRALVLVQTNDIGFITLVPKRPRQCYKACHEALRLPIAAAISSSIYIELILFACLANQWL